MELEENHTWQGAATSIVQIDDNGTVHGRDHLEIRSGGRGQIENLQCNGAKVYEEDYPRADSPHLMNRPVRRQ